MPKKIDWLTIGITALAICIVGILFYLVITIFKIQLPFFNKPQPKLYTLAGMVTDVGTNYITVKSTTYKNNTLFKISTTTETQISKSGIDSKINQIFIGEVVQITSTADLFKTNPQKVFASTVIVTPNSITITGKITSVNGKTINVTGKSESSTYSVINTSATPSIDKDYTITTTDQTDFHRITNNYSDPINPTIRESLSFSDLKPGDDVTVGYDSDGTATITAAYVQVNSVP